MTNEILDIVPTLNGRSISLVSPNDKGITKLFEWNKNVKEKLLWSNKREIPNEFEFKNVFLNKLRSYYHSFFFIKKNKTNEIIGCIYSYNFNSFDGFLFTTIYINEDNRNSAAGVETGVLFFDYLFKYYSIRKIYCDVFDYNQVSKNFLTKSGFVLEGKLKQHRFFAGKYYDLNMYALYRDVYYEKFSSIIKRINKKSRSK